MANEYRLSYTGSEINEKLGMIDALNSNKIDISECNSAIAASTIKVYNALHYGVLGDGSTNDAPALNTLVRNLYLSGGGTIYLPAGTYMLDSQITWKSNVSLVGDGVGRTILKPRKTEEAAENFSAIGYVDKDHPEEDPTADKPMVNCHFRDFTIDGEEVNVPYGANDFRPKGIFILYMADCSFENLRIQNTGATGLGIDFMRNVTINKVHCFNCGRAYKPTPDEAVVGSAGIGIATMGMAVESCVITDCIAEECGNYGIFVEGTGDTRLYKENGEWACKSHYTISNCQCFNGRHYGIAVKATYNVNVSDNIIANNARDGIFVVDRWIREEEVNGETVHIRLGCKNVSITDNQCIGNGYGKFEDENQTMMRGCGIRLDDRSKEGNNVHVMGNSLDMNPIGIKVNYRTDNLRIMNNSISNCSDTGLVTHRGAIKDFVVKDNVYVNNAKDIDCKTLFYGHVGEENELCNIISLLPYLTNEGYYDDSGSFIYKSHTLTTEDMFAMNGHIRVGIKVPKEYYPTSGDLYVGTVWYDADGNFISREGGNPVKVEEDGDFKYFLNPNDDDAAFVRIRVGYVNSDDNRYVEAFENTIINIC